VSFNLKYLTIAVHGLVHPTDADRRGDQGHLYADAMVEVFQFSKGIRGSSIPSATTRLLEGFLTRTTLLTGEIVRTGRPGPGPQEKRLTQPTRAPARICAAAWLTGQGYLLTDRNFLCKVGELDLVATLGDLLVFIDSRAACGTFRGACRIRGPAQTGETVARRLLLSQRFGMDPPACRFDVIESAEGPAGSRPITHLPDAFRPAAVVQPGRFAMLRT